MEWAYDRSRPVPTILAVNGGGRNARQMVMLCGQNDESTREGAVIVRRDRPAMPSRLERTQP
jgi:hypothetical protein